MNKLVKIVIMTTIINYNTNIRHLIILKNYTSKIMKYPVMINPCRGYKDTLFQVNINHS